MGSFTHFKDTEPFNRLPEDLLDALNKATTVKKFPPHIHIFKQHDPPSGYLYFVKEGLVEIVVLTPGGVEMVVDYRKEGDFFGGTPIFTDEAYTAGARTVKATQCYLIPKDLLTRAAKCHPHIIEHFTRTILSRVRNLYAEMVNDHAQNNLVQMEVYPFQKRLFEIMSSPVETCPPATPIREIARRMTQRAIGSMVVRDQHGRPAGIITKRDLVSRVLARETIDCNSVTAADIMTPNPFFMTPDAYMFEATTFLISQKIKHLPVLSQGEILGIVTLRDLMKYRSQKLMLLIENIKEARTVEDLARPKAEMVQVARALMAETRSHFETMEILSYIHHCILRRCFEITLEAMIAQGMNPPAIRYCLILMGSGGRKEMLLAPDQDNGLIFENYPDSMVEEMDAFFLPFTEKLISSFERIGYPLCNGKVMANNPLWRGRLKAWQARIGNWIHVPEPKKVMYSTIFLDFMPLVGDPTLCQDLREILHREISKNTIFLYHLLENELSHKPPVGLLGRFVVDKSGEHQGQLSLKQAGSVFIVDCVRMFLLEVGADATTTVERLHKLVNLDIFNKETADHLKAAFEAFIFLRLRHEIALIDQGDKPSHYIDPYSLPKNEQDLLQEAFRAVSKLQDSAKRHFGAGLH